MIERAKIRALISDMAALFRFRGRLRPKFVAVFTTVVCVALLSNAMFEVLFSYQDRKASLIRIQHEQAEAAASEIAEFMKNIEEQLAWTTHEPWTTLYAGPAEPASCGAWCCARFPRSPISR